MRPRWGDPFSSRVQRTWIPALTLPVFADRPVARPESSIILDGQSYAGQRRLFHDQVLKKRNRDRLPVSLFSVFPLHKKAFLCLQNLALWAPPGVRKFFKRSSGGNTCFRVSFCRVVDIRTLEALPAVHIFSCHGARFAFIQIKPVFLGNVRMNGIPGMFCYPLF